MTFHFCPSAVSEQFVTEMLAISLQAANIQNPSTSAPIFPVPSYQPAVSGRLLTLSASVHAERGAHELDLRVLARLDIPLLLYLLCACLTAQGQECQSRSFRNEESRLSWGNTNTTRVLPLVRALGTTQNLVFTIDVMYTGR